MNFLEDVLNMGVLKEDALNMKIVKIHVVGGHAQMPLV